MHAALFASRWMMHFYRCVHVFELEVRIRHQIPDIICILEIVTYPVGYSVFTERLVVARWLVVEL